MKHLFVFILLCISLSCSKKEEPYPPLPADFWGEASADRNGALWTAHPACWVSIVNAPNLTVHLDSFYRNTLKESLILVNIPPEIGTHRVYKFVASTYDSLNSSLSFWESDQSLGLYEILESDSITNQVTLLSYDTLSKEIKGTFNLTFLAKDKPYPSYPDTIRLRNGKFHGRLIKK